MAWAYPSWYTGAASDNRDWALLANLNSFVGAVNERAAILGDAAPLAVFVAGDDAQAAAWFASVQVWVEAKWANFVRAYSAGTKLAVTFYDHAATLDVYDSLSDLLTRVDAGGDDAGTRKWRRYTTHPDEAGAMLFGQCAAGDIIGPWLFEDLQKALNGLVWTKATTTPVGGNEHFGEGVDADWDTAKQLLLHPWPITPDPGYGMSSPWAKGTSAHNTAGSYDAIADRFKQAATASGGGPVICDTLARAVDWHAHVAAYATPFTTIPDFDAQGEVDAEGAPLAIGATGWLRYRTETHGLGHGWTTDATLPVGDDQPPNWDAAPGVGTNNGRGFYATECRFLVRWDVPGGLAYVDTVLVQAGVFQPSMAQGDPQ